MQFYDKVKISNNFTFLHLENMQILKVSPKGQITIPKIYRDLCNTGNFALEVKGKTIILKPIEIRVVEDDTSDFSALGKESFEFWNNKDDDIYDKFYKNTEL